MSTEFGPRPIRMAWLSDLHCAHLTDPQFGTLLHDLTVSYPHLVVITGDISAADRFQVDLETLHVACGSPIYFVLGNHDFYRCDTMEPIRNQASKISQHYPIHYLRRTGPIQLTQKTALLGVDGWGDARLGNRRSTILLNDFVRIPELTIASRRDLHKKLNQLGDEEAQLLNSQLEALPKEIRRVYVITHVPPFKEASWHSDGPCSDDFLPYYSCKATGDVLAGFAHYHPDVELRVLCGHCHSGGIYQHSDNLIVHTNYSDYGQPDLEIIEL